MASYERRMIRVIEHIHADPAGDLSLDRLAEVAAMSRFHWHRVFHGMTGETCAQAVRRVRLHRAACWLVQTDWPVTQVAARAGYPDRHAFQRAFKAAYGRTPGVFRSEGALVPPLNTPLRKETEPMYDIELQDRPAMRLAALPHTGPYAEVGSAFEKIMALAGGRGLWPTARGMVGLYYDDPNAVAAGDLRSHAALVEQLGEDHEHSRHARNQLQKYENLARD